MGFVRRVTATSLVAVTLLAAQASQVLHQLLVRHEICAADGEIVESVGHAGAAALLTSRSAPVQSELRAGQIRQLHEHDQCLASPGDGDAVTGDLRAPARELFPATPLSATPTRPDGWRVIPVFRLAPKNSPPA